MCVWMRACVCICTCDAHICTRTYTIILISIYSITEDEIKRHFMTKVNTITSIRIPTKSDKTLHGFAYVEVTNNIDFEVKAFYTAFVISLLNNFITIWLLFLTERSHVKSYILKEKEDHCSIFEQQKGRCYWHAWKNYEATNASEESNWKKISWRERKKEAI